MRPPGFLRASCEVALKDLRLEWRTLDALTASLVFSLIVLVIFSFAFGFATVRQIGADRLVPGVIWSVLAFAAVVGISRSMILERQRETLSALFLAPIDRAAIYLGKLWANLVTMTALQWIVIPLSAIFFDYDLLSVLGPLVLVVFVHGLGLTELGTLFAGIVTRIGRGEALLATLLFPASTPIFISAVKCTGALLGGRGLGSVSHWIWISVGFDFVYLMLALLTFEFVLEE